MVDINSAHWNATLHSLDSSFISLEIQIEPQLIILLRALGGCSIHAEKTLGGVHFWCSLLNSFYAGGTSSSGMAMPHDLWGHDPSRSVLSVIHCPTPEQLLRLGTLLTHTADARKGKAST